LTPNTLVTIVAVAATINAHAMQDDVIAALELGPAPTAQASGVFTSASSLVADVTKGEHCCAVPLGCFPHTLMVIVCSADLALSELKCLPENGQQALVF
jgi:hypothetical protein